MKKKSLLLLFLILSLALFKVFYSSKKTSPKIKIGENVFQVELADTQEKRIKGLSGREKLDSKSGMLFVFDKPGYYSFWMKGMNFPLDFVWIREEKIVEITKDISPLDYQPPNVLTPKERVDMVFEINAGEANEFRLKIGDELKFLTLD